MARLSKAEKQEIASATEFLKRIGVVGVKRPFFPLIERNYIKFCSDSGVSDIAQAQLFEKFMTKKFGAPGVKYASERAFFMNAKARAFVEATLDLHQDSAVEDQCSQEEDEGTVKISAAKKKMKAL